ncbi:MAG: hypothetical protein KDC80_20840 [Saprospiraceae bacterium]|nr:hypothetical protein [Saprospiraceae bacterium]
MKRASINDLDRLFSQQLSEQKLSQAFPDPLPVEIWDRIREQIPAKRTFRYEPIFIWVLSLGVILMIAQWSLKDAAYNLSDLDTLPIMAGFKMKIENEGRPDDPLQGQKSLTFLSESDAAITGSDKQSALIPGDFSGRKKELSDKHLAAMPVITVPQSSQPDPVYQELPPGTNGNRVLNPLTTRNFSLANKPIPLLRNPSGGEVRAEKSSVWSLEFSGGGLVGDYFFRGQSFLDGTALQSIERKWSPTFGLAIRRQMKENVSLITGVRYSIYRTQANYEFQIPHAQSLEVPVPDGYERIIDHNIPTIGGEFSATTLIGRDLQSDIPDNEIIPLQAGLLQKVHLLTIPLGLEADVLTRSPFRAGIRIGLELNIPLSPLQLKQGELRSLHEMISYESISLRPLQNEIQKDIYGSYLFGTYFNYEVGKSGYSLVADFIYSNSISPAFQLMGEKIYPRNMGVVFGINKKF